MQCREFNELSTARQVETARWIYAGVANPRTRETIMAGPAPGGEPAWFAY